MRLWFIILSVCVWSTLVKHFGFEEVIIPSWLWGVAIIIAIIQDAKEMLK